MNHFQRWRVARSLRKQFYEMNGIELRQHQIAQLNRIWDFTREHSQYYQNIYPQPISIDKVAPINKSTMMEHYNEINTAKLDRDTLVSFRMEMEKKGGMDYFDGKYSVGLSSGTTGSRLLTVLSKKERNLYSCLLWARSGIPRNIRKFRVLFALRTFNPAFTEISVFGVKMVYVDYFNPIEELIQLINMRQLNIIAGPPSLLLMIARQKKLIDHPIEVVVSYAEVLEDHIQEMLQSTFRAPVVQIYQGAEGLIGTTCTKGHIHLNEDVLLVEPLNDPANGPTKVLITDLYRYTQPWIRYELDDILELSTTPCPCGSVFRVIKRIHGRADEVFVLFDKNHRPCYFFPDYVSRAINQSSKDILEYQAIQHTPTWMEIRLELKDEKDRVQIETEILKNLSWRIEKLGAEIGKVEFTNLPPERNPQSKKLVRVTRRFPWNY